MGDSEESRKDAKAQRCSFSAPLRLRVKQPGKFYLSRELLDRVLALDHALVATALAAAVAARWLALRLAVGALRDLRHHLLQLGRNGAHLVLILLRDRVAQILDQAFGAAF